MAGRRHRISSSAATSIVEVSDNEFEFSISAGTGDLLPGGKIEARWKKTWVTRKGRFGQRLIESSGLSAAEVDAATEEVEALADLLHASMNRAASTRHDDYADALATLVAAAFTDRARVDEVEFLTNILLRLEPFDLRILKAGYQKGTNLRRGVFSPAKVCEILGGVDRAFVLSAAARLNGAGLLNRAGQIEEQKYGPGKIGGTLPTSHMVLSYMHSELGQRAVDLCYARFQGTAESHD